MKKVLYSTTALAAAGMFAFSGADALAAEKVKLGLSGGFTALVGVINNENDKYDNLNSINVVGDSEINFKGNTTLDNGIRVDVIIDLETDHNQANNGNVLDESYIKFGNMKAWGEFRFGTTKQAHFVTGRAGIPIGNPLSNPTNPDQPTRFLPTPTKLSTFNHEGGGDRMLMSYYTPRISGFQAGVSYTPGHANSDTPAASDGMMATDSRNTSIGANFKGKFGDASVNLAGGWTAVDGGKAATPISIKSITGVDGSNNIQGTINPAKDASEVDYTTVQLGASVGFAGFSFGVQWAEREDNRPMMHDSDIEGFVMGATYATGPWKVGVNWSNATQDTKPDTPGENESNMYTLGISYALGAGVTAGASLVQSEYEAASGMTDDGNEGWAMIGGLKVAF